MSRLLRLIGFGAALAEDDRAAATAALRAAGSRLPGIRDIILGTTIQPSLNSGDLIWRLEFDSTTARDAALASTAWRDGIDPLFGADGPLRAQEHVAFEADRSGGSPVRAGIYRIALFHANQSPTTARIAQFGEETAAMPRYVKTIRRWTLTPPSTCQGTRPWTTVWEQEYDDRAGLEGPYLTHPVHWAHIDRWFDPEYPEWLVDPYLCHSYCTFSRG